MTGFKFFSNKDKKTVKIPYKKLMRIRNLFDLNDIKVYRQSNDSLFKQKIYNRIIRRYFPYMIKEISSLKVVGYDFDDLMQESYIVVFEVLEKAYRPERRAPFWPFLRMCIKRNLFSLVTTSRNQKNIMLNNSSHLELITDNYLTTNLVGSHESQVIDKITALLVLKELKKSLSDLEYKSFIEKNINSLTYQEISQKYGFDLKQIDNALNRVSKKIKRISSLLEIRKAIAS